MYIIHESVLIIISDRQIFEKLAHVRNYYDYIVLLPFFTMACILYTSQYTHVEEINYYL